MAGTAHVSCINRCETPRHVVIPTLKLMTMHVLMPVFMLMLMPMFTTMAMLMLCFASQFIVFNVNGQDRIVLKTL